MTNEAGAEVLKEKERKKLDKQKQRLALGGYLSAAEAELLTGRTVAAWRMDIRKRRIAIVKIGRQVRIPRSEIERLIRDGFRPAVAVGERR